MMEGRTGRLRNGKTRDIHPQFSVASHAPTLAPPLPHTLQSSHAPTPTRALPDPLMLGWRVLARTRSTSSCASSSLGERHKFTFSRLSYCTHVFPRSICRVRFRLEAPLSRVRGCACLRCAPAVVRAFLFVQPRGFQQRCAYACTVLCRPDSAWSSAGGACGRGYLVATSASARFTALFMIAIHQHLLCHHCLFVCVVFPCSPNFVLFGSGWPPLCCSSPSMPADNVDEGFGVLGVCWLLLREEVYPLSTQCGCGRVHVWLACLWIAPLPWL